MTRHFVPSVAKRKGYAIPDETVTAPLQRPMPHVRRISIGAVPKLTDMKRRHTVTPVSYTHLTLPTILLV